MAPVAPKNFLDLGRASFLVKKLRLCHLR